MLRTVLTLILILLFLPSLAPAEEFDLTFRPLPDGSVGRDLSVPTRDGLFVYGYVRKLELRERGQSTLGASSGKCC